MNIELILMILEMNTYFTYYSMYSFVQETYF